MPQPTLEAIVALAKKRGFIYQTSEIYGGLANSYDFGPMGAELLRNIRNLWWREFITKRSDMVGLDTQILLHPQTWVASGHVDSFTDPLVEDKVTHNRYRADHLIESHMAKHSKLDGQEMRKDQKSIVKEQLIKPVIVEEMSKQEMNNYIRENNLKSPDGNDLTDPKDFNILFETAIGSVAGYKSKAYLRGETAQGIFTNFKQVLDSTRVTLPFGIGQIGKSFRNEITTGQFIFRTLEFEQGEIEYFFDPDNQDWQTLFKDWQQAMWDFCTNTLGVKAANLRWRQHTDQERSHYSKETYDLDYNFPFGWKELWGIAYRTDYDLKQHMRSSKKSLEYTDPKTGNKLVPHVIEPAVGINRIALMLLVDAYTTDEAKKRTLLKLKPNLTPYQLAVFPLLANKPELIDKAAKVRDMLTKSYSVAWDQRGNIGKRYLSQDEIGTPFCVTVDFDTLSDDAVTVRDRDTAKQDRVNLDKLNTYFHDKLAS